MERTGTGNQRLMLLLPGCQLPECQVQVTITVKPPTALLVQVNVSGTHVYARPGY